MEKNLSQLAPGESGEVTGIICKGAAKRRFMDMGIVAGSVIKVERVAPLGDPIEIRVRGYSLSIRKADAAGIKII